MISPLPNTQEDVISLRRLGPDRFEATQRSGDLWIGDQKLLYTLPQGRAKHATLIATEHMSARQAHAKREHPATIPTNAGGRSTEPPAKRARACTDTVDTEGTGASEHVVRQEQADCDMDATDAQYKLFHQGTASDHALLAWLWAERTLPRCSMLLQQISEWTGQGYKRMRSLAQAQGITVSKKRENTCELLLQEVRKHFREAIRQEKGRLRAFDFQKYTMTSSFQESGQAASGAPEHVPGECLAAADVTDVPTLKRFRLQHKDMPIELRTAILQLAGGVTLNRRVLQNIAKGMGMHLQNACQYPGPHQLRPQPFRLPEQLKITMLTTACIRKVRSWGAATLDDAGRPSSDSRTPETQPELANMLRDPEGRLRCPFGIDWEDKAGRSSRLDREHRIPFWLALIEMHGDGYRYGMRSGRNLPFVFERLIEYLRQARISRQQASQGASEHFIGVPDDLEKALLANPVFKDKVATHDLLIYSLQDSGKYLAMIPREQVQRGSERVAEECLLPALAAKEIVTAFFDFVQQYSLVDSFQEMSPEQIQVTALFLNNLRHKPLKRIHVSERLDFLQKKRAYTPAADVESPEVPHFLKMASAHPDGAEYAPPKLQAPFVCQLCSAGFITMAALWQHAAAKHHSWSEYRKRLIFEVQQCQSVPLPPAEKRRLAGNFYQDLLYSRPARDTLRPKEVTMRQVVACATCAIKDWIDDFYPCYAWKDAPSDALAGASKHDEQDEQADTDDDVDESTVPHKRAAGPSLRDADGFCYLGPVGQIDAILNVQNYVHVVPLAPLEELHASSVQHPSFPDMRWLMNTRRVPVLPRGSGGIDGSAEDARPSCAGVGDATKPCWLCHHCASHLCQLRPRMPPQALANWNWGGREHPKYQDLSMATKSLLGLGKLVARMVLLKPRDDTDDCEKALVGNTILVAQPSPEMIASELPPSETEQAQYFNVIYAAGAAEHGSSTLRKKKALLVNREQYLECAQIRKERCPLFADTRINIVESGARLPATGVPTGLDQGAVHMESVQYFSPTLSGPATEGTPFRAQDNADEAEDAEPESHGDDSGDAGDADTGCSRALDSLVAEENANAEFLIGLDGTPDDDAMGKLAAARTKLNMAEDVAKRLRASTVRLQASVHDPDVALAAAAEEAALRADHTAVLVDLRTVARGMGEHFAEEVESNITAAHRASKPATLRMHTGAPLSLFDPAAWVACHTEFFYGDCAPNLQRPAKIGWRSLFRYLMNREELEYHLDSDVETYGKRYTANSDSRWNTPEFAALAADAIRKLQVLQSTKVFWAKTGHTFCKDMKILANTTDKDFEDFQLNLQRAAIQNVPITALISQAKAQGCVAVQKTLQHVLMHTATTAFSEGAKTTFRHMGGAMNDRFGPFSTFFTTNFADTYHVLTEVLAQGAFEPLGPRPLNILQDSPPMPTSQTMHKILAARPMVQANLFLFLDAITHQNLVAARRVFLGRRKYDPTFRWPREPHTEDDFTSSGDFGISGFVRCLIKALEAQGRGFAHGHEKHHSEPKTKAIDLVVLFLGKEDRPTGATEHGHDRDSELQEWMAKHRDAHLRDAATKQFDSAVESGRQFGCPDLKEVFTADEKKRCRLDGEADDDGTLRLPNVEVVPAADPGHVLRERHAAEHEGRPLRHAYRDMPLTGAPAARFPAYLQAGQFDRYPDLDENGHDAETLLPGASEHSCDNNTGWFDATALYETDEDGEVTGFLKADGSKATEHDLEVDARRYAKNFASDARFCHVYNHSHVCKPTCFKKTEYKRPNPDDPARQRQACRFRFWRLVLIAQSWFRRMGKALVPQPTVAAEDDEGNEFGRCKVCRANCFRGSTNDLCQVCLRCNVDYQYQNRTFPNESDQSEPSPVERPSTHAVLQSMADEAGSAHQGFSRSGVRRTRLPRVLRGLARQAGVPLKTGIRLLSTFAVAMRSSSVADFYATKYLAKPQQWLATALGPLISGFRRVEEERKQTETPLSTKSLALRKMRTAIFAAFRSVWISPCEACLFIQTGGSAVLSHPDVVVHGHKGLFMMHECKRILNNQVAGEGLWHADLAKARDLQEGDVTEVLGARVSMEDGSEHSETDDDSMLTDTGAVVATEHPDGAEDGAAADLDDTGVATEHSEGAEAEHADDVQQKDCGPDSAGPAAPEEEAGLKAQIFQVTISLRDDWLHRGNALQDMDLQTYAEYIERAPKPIRGLPSAKGRQDLIFAFDDHYKLAPNYMQVMVPAGRRKIARFNMAKCEKENVNEGEENAQFKALHCALVRCPGPGSCADPLMCAGTLFPNAAGEYRFATAWRARESEIKVLARRGYAKKLKARRLETLHDTTLCKVLQSTADPHPDETLVTPEARTASTMLQIDLQRWFRQGLCHLRANSTPESPCTYGYTERMVHDILLFSSGADRPNDVRGMPMWHEEQLHLAEWQALQQLEYLFNLTLSVDAKNLAIEQLKAQKKKGADAEAFDAARPLHAADDDLLAAIAELDDTTLDAPHGSGRP